jgi:SWI/SNF chromatin-remodeling complex subunit SWI1
MAKLLARQDPNRLLYRSLFNQSSSSVSSAGETPLDLLTRAFALAISVLPDRTKGNINNTTQLRIVEARKAHLTQGMLAADILTTLLPASENGRARRWIESEDGWAVGLLNLAALLSVDRNHTAGKPPGQRDSGMMDTESLRLISQRGLGVVKRLAERAGKEVAAAEEEEGKTNIGGPVKHVNGEDGNEAEEDLSYEELLEPHKRHPKWEGIPQGHAILGALMMPSTDKVALGLLCGLHEMAMR